MKMSTIVLIVVLILTLYYYTAENFEIVETVGRHVYDFFTGMYTNLQEKADKGIIEGMLDWLKNIIYN